MPLRHAGATPIHASTTHQVENPAGSRRLPRPSTLPTQLGPMGLRYDFNDGCRVMLPETGRPWRVRLSDLDTGNLLYEVGLRSGHVNSAKRYFVRFRIEVWSGNEPVLCHDYHAADRDVLIQFPVGTIGDIIGWLSYAMRFKELHRCRLTCALGEPLIPLFRGAYPDVRFVSHADVEPARFYATYSVALFFDDHEQAYQPSDFRQVGLHRTAAYILGVDPAEQPPRIALADVGRPIADPYVCIGVQATTQCKYWNNPHGWPEIVDYIKALGYRVVCIDQKPRHGRGMVWTEIPEGAADETGDRPLQERARWLKHAAAFVGLSSGLSWLAWAAGTPVVMISGFTHPVNEFATPYRVINYHACNSCWNDVRHRFDHGDFLWCPRHRDTPRQFECTRLINADQVKAALARIPGFGHGTAGALAPRIDEALAVRALPAPAPIGVHRGGMAVGITPRAGALRDLAASHVRAGDHAAGKRDHASALRDYQAAATIMQRLATAEPDNIPLLRDQAVSWNRIAAVLTALGDHAGAADQYRRSLGLVQHLMASAPHHPDLQRDLAWSQARLADVLVAHAAQSSPQRDPA
ncbi:autotransporter strand-loop-strand O-heptosyltransferase [Bradyrhizobium sp. SZCCHNR3118]|uniref:autotransporter strand-loop-strand O-heptosyltransferase n=1 Tax=Bradyrhizobium sp. SZCCHNR3118 TaxID=3057468 RepID=UPI002916FED0|nr:autotransporter strand-loop-strand O-heptosyltransferase [Bradyrhizobium sp. SZCCHNR3118]